MQLKLLTKRLLIGLCLFFLIILSSCKMTVINQERIFESDILEFYDNNIELLNKASEEYTVNTKGKTITIFFKDGLYLEGIDSDLDDVDVVIWEPETKTEYTKNISEYENCKKTLFLMDKFMLEHGFTQRGKDYIVTITTCGLNNGYNADIANISYVILFDFFDVKCNVSYRLLYSENELTKEFSKVDDNWYTYVWYSV